MILYRVLVPAKGRFAWESKQKPALDAARDYAAAGLKAVVDKFDVPTSKQGLCDFLNVLIKIDYDDYDAVKCHAGGETVKVFEPEAEEEEA